MSAIHWRCEWYFSHLNVSFKLFADDIELYSCYDITCADDLCIAIKQLCDWSTVWQLNIAVEKCFMCCITSNRMITTVSQHRYMIIDKVLDTVETVRDLGVIVDYHLKFDAHISSIVHKAMVRARLILRCFVSRNCKLLLKAYMTYVRPILEYCSSVWSPHHKYLINKIESFKTFLPRGYLVCWIYRTLSGLPV